MVNSAIYYGAWPNEINSVMRQVAPRAADGEIPSSSALKAIFEAAKNVSEQPPKVHFWAEAAGTLNGKKAQCKVYSEGPWATNANLIATTTGVLTFAAEKLATGSIDQRGLVTASDVLDPDEVFQHLAGSDNSGVVIQISH